MALDILHDNWGPYTHTEVENALKAYLAVLENRINQAIQSGGVGLTDLSAEVQALLAKANTALQSYTETDPTVPSWAKQPTKPTYTAQEVGALPANTTIPSKTSELNNDSGFVTEAVQSVSVDTNGDGTVDINVDDDTYTINLNHTHEGMVKLVVCEESDLPATLDEDTIYGVNEDGEISVLYVGGIPFYGGGGGASSGPVLRRPADGSTVDLGHTTSGSLSETVNLKGKNLTENLTIEIDGTGYTFGSTQPTGVTVESTTELTVTAAAANALAGVDIVVEYSGSDSDVNAEGTLGITSGSPDNISAECSLLVNETVIEDLTAVKFTGNQIAVTPYYPNPNTHLEFDIKFESCGRDEDTTAQFTWFNTYKDDGVAEVGAFYSNFAGSPPQTWQIFMWANQGYVANTWVLNFQNNKPAVFNRSVFKYQNNSVTFNGLTTATETKTTTQIYPLCIGGYYSYANTINRPFDYLYMYIYSVKIYEGATQIHNFLPKTYNGVAGLYDTITKVFCPSITGTELVGIE